MNAFDRDAELERRQIQEISLNVARRLLDVLERRHMAPPAVTAEITAGARVIADIQRQIDGLMGRWPEGHLLDMPVLTHVLESQSRALSLIEDLEAKADTTRPPHPRPDPERTHAALIATAREIEREVSRYEAAPHGHGRAPPAPVPAGARPRPQGATRPPPHAQTPPPSARTVRSGGGPAARHPQQPMRTQGHGPHPPQPRRDPAPASRPSKIRALTFTPIGATALVACIAILAASLAGALSFALSTDEGGQHAVASHTPDGKFDGRLSQDDAMPTSGSDILVVSPPENVAALTQPYLVVIATRRSTEELEQDFRYFKEAYPELLGNARGRVDSVQSQDGKTWYRLSLIPPRAQSEASELCTELKSAGLTECWIKPLPIGQSSG